ncbi:hypothetical protein HDZ31DRAFT_43118 [Schizophyllum fasciatum]
MSLDATDTGDSAAQSSPRVTPPPFPTEVVLRSSGAADTPMTSGAGDTIHGFRIVHDLFGKLKVDLASHYVKDVPVLTPGAREVGKINAFLQRTDLYDVSRRRWKFVPANPEDERKLYAPHTAMFNAILAHFKLSSRRFILTADIPMKHEPDQRESLVTRPDYSFVGKGPVINGKGKFSPSDDTFNVVWADYVNLAAVGDGKTERSLGPLTNGAQLAVYARQCFLQQHNRDFVFGFIMTEKRFRVYRFDRSGMMSTVALNYHEEAANFIHLMRLILSGQDADIGFNTTLYFGPIGGKRTRFLRSIFAVDKDMIKSRARDPLPPVEPAAIDSKHGLDSIKVDKPATFVLKELTFRVHNQPLYARRGLRGRGGVYWASSHPEFGEVLIKQSYIPVTRVPEYEYLKKAANLEGVGQMLAYETRSWTVAGTRWPGGIKGVADRVYTSVVLRRYGKSVEHFGSRRQLLFAFRDSIKGHRNLWWIWIIHRDVSIHNILLGLDDAADGWKGVLIDLDMAISARRERSDLGVDFRTASTCFLPSSALYLIVTMQGTRAFQSIQVLRSCAAITKDPKAPAGSQRLMHDYMDDLESFYWCLCWICFSYDGPGQPTENEMLDQWQQSDPAAAANAKVSHLTSPWSSSLVKPYFRRDFNDLLENLHTLFHRSYQMKQKIVAKGVAHKRTLEEIRAESKGVYDYVLGAIETAIDEAGDEDAHIDEADALDPDPPVRLELPILKKPKTRKLGPTTTSSSFTNKRKASEESDEAPEQKKQASTAVFAPSSLRHSESIDP